MIVVAETQCVGVEHAQVNAALLRIILRYHGGDGVVFAAEPGHLAAVGELLQDERSGFRFLPLAVAPRHCSQLRRLPYELAILWRLAGMLAGAASERLLLSSLSAASLVALAIVGRVRRGIRAIGVAHGVLETVKETPRWGGLRKALNFRKSLFRPRRRGFLLLVNGDFIRSKLEEVLPALQGRVAAIPLPYDFGTAQPLQAERHGPVRFGALGIASRNKGSQLLEPLAEKIHSEHPGAARFLQIGPVVDDSMPGAGSGRVEVPSQQQPIAELEYVALASTLDYSLVLHDPAKYELSCSASVLDSFRFRKPIVALRNSGVDYYASVMGDIGYLCDDLDQVAETISSICDEFPSRRYAGQVLNIEQGVREFSIDKLTGHFQAAVAGYWAKR